MAKLVLTDITSGYASTTATNANNTLIETALENTLSRDGTSPNQMLVDLDMNGHRILNELAQTGDGFIWKGAWTTALSYSLNNLVSNASSSYICTVVHTAGANFATDLAAGKWQLLAQQGLPGAGTGDMLVANNLSELTATKTTARGNISAASSGINNDIIQLTGLTTPLSVAQGGTGLNVVGASGNVLTSNGSVWTSAILSPAQVPVRQTVLSGPVSSGQSAFGGSTGSATVTANGVLIATAANGFGSSGAVNRIGTITNPAWTGLSTNGTMFLYLDIATDGTCTTGSGTLEPQYQWGGTYSGTANQFTFNIQEMVGKVAGTQTYRVYVGEVTVAGGVTTAIIWYSLMGRYDSGWTATLPSAGATTTKNHNIGINDVVTDMRIECTTIDNGYAVGDQLHNLSIIPGANNLAIPFMTTRKAMSYQLNASYGHYIYSASSQLMVVATAASWKYKMTASRGW